MEKLWDGLFSAGASAAADAFNSSIGFDSRMYQQDIKGSMAHAAMLGAKGIISEGDSKAIIDGLAEILRDMEAGKLIPTAQWEDIHSFVEAVLTERIGDPGRRLHTARSRNDQVALDLRLYLRDEAKGLKMQIKALMAAIVNKAEEAADMVVPGYTHLQRAQPITFGHHLMAYAMMLQRDLGRLSDCVKRMNESPLGACALAGTTYDTDRGMTAKTLGFSSVCRNSLDAVSDRDFCVELLACLSTLMMHLSRLSEELVLWCSWEFRFVQLADDFSTGSSIMPQKKNPDMAELCRGKTGRVYGHLMSVLTMLKGLPLAYNKDMQEDKEAVFDALDTVKACLGVFAPMIETMTLRPENMRRAAAEGFINATDLADYLVAKGMPFRTAYKTVGILVALCIEGKTVLEKLPLSAYKEHSELFGEDLYSAIDLEECVRRRISQGGTGPQSVRAQIAYMREFLKHG